MGLLVILTGCPNPANMAENKIEPKAMVYFTFFDTVSYIYSYADDTQEEFQQNCDEVSRMFVEYNKLFDIYHEYTGVTNLCTLNKNAGGEWLQVDERLVDFLLYAKELYNKTDGEMNIMMGAVLRPWHNAREEAKSDPSNARIPDAGILEEASRHIGIELLEIDAENSRVRISDADALIDVGALGKGYATEKAAEYLKNKNVTSYVLNIGGNIRIIGQKPDGSGWLTGIKNPQAPDTYVSYITISDTSCVTSGNYERYFTADGERYHHIIDKDTLMPANYFASVSIICPDSGLADALSTALFCMDVDSGRQMISQFENVEVLWIEENGSLHMTDGYSALVTEK